MGERAVITRSQKCCGHRIVGGALLAVIATIGFIFSASPASAQNFFEALFGNRRWSPPGGNAYADPNQQGNPFGQRQEPRESGVAFCVRTCDGRFYPIQRHAGMTAAQACSSFCPASQTKIYSGSTIDRAVGSDGKRYSELPAAFTYREKIVPGCTCNGKDAFGLVTPSVNNDPTLRTGDIVATNSGMMAYNNISNNNNGNSSSSSRRQVAEFTPIESAPGISNEVRQRLSETKIVPSEGGPAPIIKMVQPETTASIPAVNRSKRAQNMPAAAPSRQQSWRPPWFW